MHALRSYLYTDLCTAELFITHRLARRISIRICCVVDKDATPAAMPLPLPLPQQARHLAACPPPSAQSAPALLSVGLVWDCFSDTRECLHPLTLSLREWHATSVHMSHKVTNPPFSFKPKLFLVQLAYHGISVASRLLVDWQACLSNLLNVIVESAFRPVRYRLPITPGRASATTSCTDICSNALRTACFTVQQHWPQAFD